MHLPCPPKQKQPRLLGYAEITPHICSAGRLPAFFIHLLIPYTMDFGTSVKHVFSNYATFSGRASRSEYWYFTLFNLLVTIALYIVGFILGATFGSGYTGIGVGYSIGEVLNWIYTLATIIPCLAVFCRRMHDTGRSGWWWFICLIPIVGAIVLLVFLCQDTQPANQYGPVPADKMEDFGGNAPQY